MIARLQGNIALKELQTIILDVHGVGYKVYAPSHVIAKVHAGEDVVVYTHTHVRDDLLELYGFLEYADLKLFELLISVSGIGCKTALGIFNNGNREDIMRAILSANVDFFSGIPRLGKKNAQKIIIELKSKLGSSGEVDLAGVGGVGEEVLEALKTFGYTGREAAQAVKAVKGEGETTEEKVRLALKYLGK